MGSRVARPGRLVLFGALAVALLALAGAGAAPARDEASPPIRVMSFNVRLGVVDDGANSWDRRKDLLVETVRGFAPDLLGTQETWDFQASYLLEGLTGYEHVGWPRRREPLDGEQCAVFFRSERFTKLDAGQFALSETPEVEGSMGWDAAYPRIATWVRLRDRESGDSLLFMNTHLDNRGAEARLESARLLRSRLADLAPDGVWILTGDFNTGEGSPPYAVLTGAEGPGVPGTDAFRAARPVPAAGEGTFNGFTGDRSGDRIDWILHSPAFETLSADIDRMQDEGRFPSDHFPVTAVLRRR